MNKLSILFFSLLFIVGCEKPEIIITEPITPVCSLDVLVYKCSIFPCDNGTTQFLAQTEVQLFETEFDALNGINMVGRRFTDESGSAKFASIDCGVVFLKVKHEVNGTYIGYENLTLASSNNFHEVRFVSNYYYDENDSAGLKQDHISLELPTVGQSSAYRYFENYNHISFTPLEYTDVYLNVTITEQLDEHSFIVEERLDSLYGSLSWPTGGSSTFVKNIWTITEEEVFVSPLAGEYFTSFMWGLSEWFVTEEKDGYSFSLIRSTEEEIDMEADVAYALDAYWVTRPINDYYLFGKTFTELIGEKISYNSFDGPIKFRVYNKHDGLVRSLKFYDGGSSSSKGFDLVL